MSFAVSINQGRGATPARSDGSVVATNEPSFGRLGDRFHLSNKQRDGAVDAAGNSTKDYDISETWKKRSFLEKIADRPIYNGGYYLVSALFGAGVGAGVGALAGVMIPAIAAVALPVSVVAGIAFCVYMANTTQPISRY